MGYNYYYYYYYYYYHSSIPYEPKVGTARLGFRGVFGILLHHYCSRECKVLGILQYQSRNWEPYSTIIQAS